MGEPGPFLWWEIVFRDNVVIICTVTIIFVNQLDT